PSQRQDTQEGLLFRLPLVQRFPLHGDESFLAVPVNERRAVYPEPLGGNKPAPVGSDGRPSHRLAGDSDQAIGFQVEDPGITSQAVVLNDEQLLLLALRPPVQLRLKGRSWW